MDPEFRVGWHWERRRGPIFRAVDRWVGDASCTDVNRTEKEADGSRDPGAAEYLVA